MRKRKATVSFQFMITCIFIPIIICVVVLTGASSFHIAESNQETTISESTLSVLHLTCDYFNNRLSDVVSIMVNIQNSPALATVLRDLDNGISISPNSYVSMQEYLTSVFSRNYSYIDAIAIGFKDAPDTIFYESYYHVSRLNMQWKESTNKNVLSWRDFGTESMIVSSGEPRKSAGLSMVGITEQGKRYAICLDIKESFIKQSLSNLYANDMAKVALIDTSNNMFFGFEGTETEDSLINMIQQNPAKSAVMQSRNALVVYDSLKINSWRIAVCYDKDKIFNGIQLMKQLNIFSIIVIALSSIAISVLFAWIIARPLKRFSTQVSSINIDHLEGTHFDNSVTVSSEIKILSESLENLLCRIQVLISDIEKRQDEHLKMQNSLLLAQINPHFLYNTLYAIAQECNLGETEEASNMLYELSGFFRLGLNAGKEIVPLSDERDHVLNYLKLIARSFPYLLEYHIEITQDLLDYQIPKMTLQPIVENCFKHGLRNRRAGGRIYISAISKNDGEFIITITDDGVGMNPEDLESLRQRINKGDSEQKGFGMYNVNQRIKNYFGLQYGLMVTSEVGKGTTVTILLPKKQEKEETKK